VAPGKAAALWIVGAIALFLLLRYLLGFSLLRSVVVVVLALGALAFMLFRSGARDAPSDE
jgi:hypothetical protein